MERNTLARQIINTCPEMTRLGLNQGTAGTCKCTLPGRDVNYPDGYSRMTNSPESHIVYINAEGSTKKGNYLPADASGCSGGGP